MLIKQKSSSNFSQKMNRLYQQVLKKALRYLLILLVAAVVLLVVIRYSNVLNPQVVVEPDGHFFSQPIQVQLSAQTTFRTPQIRYTIDSSQPTVGSTLYTQPFLVEQTTVVKSALFDRQGKRMSAVTTHDFYVDADHQLPIVSIITDPKNLWDPETGIYVLGNNENFEQTGREWQRPAVFRFYETDKSLEVDQEIGIRIHGGGSRELPQKTFRLYASHNDNQGLFEHNFFPESEITKFKTLLLRPSATDWEASFMRDVLIHRIARNSSDIDTQADRPAAVYLNGRYWGLYYLRERYDQEYFHQKYHLDPRKLSILEVPHDFGETRGNVVVDEGNYQSDADLYNQLLKEAGKCRHCAHFNHFNQYLDLQNFIDYNIYEIHFANFDWPYGNHKLWRYHNTITEQNTAMAETFPTGLDGRYRWLLYDLDVGFGFTSETRQEIKQAAKDGGYGRMIDDHFPFRNLFYDPTFQENYFNRYANLLETSLSSNNVIAEINQLEAELETEMPRQIERWKDHVSGLGIETNQSIEEWRYQVDLLRTYAQHRPEYMQENTLEKFNETFQDNPMRSVTVNVEPDQAGSVKIHNTSIKELPYTGRYFPNVSINITAQPHSGYRFVRWEGNVYPGQQKRKKIRINLRRDYQLTAVFAKTGIF